jgi:hypothetical protein
MIALLHSKSLKSSGRSTPVVCILVVDKIEVVKKRLDENNGRSQTGKGGERGGR